MTGTAQDTDDWRTTAMDEDQTAQEKERDALLDPARVAVVEELCTIAAVQEERAVVGYVGSVEKAIGGRLGRDRPVSRRVA